MNELMEILELFGLRGVAEEVLAALGTAALVVGLVVGIWQLIMYLLKASGVYTMAKRRGIRRAWLAWVPVADYWVMGSLADQFRQTVKGKRSYQRVILLVLSIVTFVVTWVLNGIQIGILADGLQRAAAGDINSLGVALALAMESGGLLGPIQRVLNIVLLVFWQIALYNVYTSWNPQLNTLFVILGVFFPVVIPFFLFCNRNRDEGMRIPQPQGYMPQETGDAVEYL